jgi:hypothetical protein
MSLERTSSEVFISTLLTYNNPLIIVNRNVDHLSPPGRIGLQLWQELVLSGNSPLKALEPYIFLFDEHFGQLFPDIAGSVMSAGIDLSSNGKDLRSHFSEDMIRMFYRKESQNWYPEPREMSGHALTLKTLVEQQLAAIRRIYNKTQFELVTSTTNNLHTIQLPYASNPDSVPYWRKKWGEQGKPPLTVQDFFGWCMNGPSVIQVAAGYEHEGELYMSVASSNPMADIYDSVPMLIDPNDRHIVDGNLLLDQVIYELYEAYGKDDYFLLWSLIEKTQLANYGIHAVPVRSRNWYDTDAESQIASRNHTFAKQFHQLKDYNLPITIASSTDGWNHTTRDPSLRHTMSLQHESIFADNPQYYDRIQQLFQDQRLTDDATRIISQINLNN